MIALTARFTAEAAHRLNLGAEHKCSRLHGHRYEIEITVALTGALDGGMVWDADALRAVIAPIIAKIDHHDLNDLDCSIPQAAAVREQPTVENLALWLFARLAMLSNTGRTTLTRVRVAETERLWAEVTP